MENQHADNRILVSPAGKKKLSTTLGSSKKIQIVLEGKAHYLLKKN